jgi:hypothetical protein
MVEKKLTNNEIERMEERCKLIPFGDEASSIFHSAAMDAVSAVVLTLQASKKDGVSKIAKAAECAIDRVDGEIMAQIWQLYNRAIGPDDYDAVEKQVFLHPAMQEELKRHEKVLKILENIKTLTWETVRTLQELAR